MTAGGTALVAAVGYNVMGQIVNLDMSGSSATDTTFIYHPKSDASGGGLGDSNFRLKTIQHGAAGSGNALPDLSFEYDRVGNISKMVAVSTAGTDTQEFGYDWLNRLQSAWATGGVANYSHIVVPGVVADGYDYDRLGNIIWSAGIQYGYNDTAHKQAVTHLDGVQKFWYDANGNMTKRIEGSVTYDQLFDAENRLISVTPVGGTATTFAYDASGQRVKTVEPAGKTTYFPFPGYSEEMVGTTVTARRVTYTIAGQAVASRVQTFSPAGNTLYRLYTDHLGSTVTHSTMSGGTVGGTNTYYLPYGSYRGTPPTPPLTDRDFTGQRENRELGLLYYNARFYVPSIGRFASADTIVPDPANPQQFNRYTYSLGNPVKYTDASGHCVDGITTWACIAAGIALATKVIDYGMTAWDGYQAGRVLADANASQADKTMAGLTVGLSILFEAIEPDDLLPIGLPADDIARRTLLNGAQEALDEGGTEALEGYLRNNLGDHADGVINKMDELLGGCAFNSFEAGTLVMTVSGPIPIEEIQEGSIVLAYNEATGEIGYYPVTNLISHVDEVVVYLTIDGETMVTTADHPFYTGEGVWVEAGDLEPGDAIRTATWTTGQVEAMTIATDPQPMYNFTVAAAHTYFVGDGKWLVHNAGCDSLFEKFDDALRSARNQAGDLGADTKKMFDPETGTLIGEMSTDGKRGWRIDGNHGDGAHVNWWDWSQGKKGAGGKYGHSYFPDSELGPHSKHIGYADWE